MRSSWWRAGSGRLLKSWGARSRRCVCGVGWEVVGVLVSVCVCECGDEGMGSRSLQLAPPHLTTRPPPHPPRTHTHTAGAGVVRQEPPRQHCHHGGHAARAGVDVCVGVGGVGGGGGGGGGGGRGERAASVWVQGGAQPRGAALHAPACLDETSAPPACLHTRSHSNAHARLPGPPATQVHENMGALRLLPLLTPQVMARIDAVARQSPTAALAAPTAAGGMGEGAGGEGAGA